MTNPNASKPKDDTAVPVTPSNSPKSIKASPKQIASDLPKQLKQQQQESRSSEPILTGQSLTPQANQRPSTPDSLESREAYESKSKSFNFKTIPKGNIQIYCLDRLLDFVEELNRNTEDGLEEKAKKLKEEIKKQSPSTPLTLSLILYANRNYEVYSARNKNTDEEIQEVFYVSSTASQKKIDQSLRIKYGNNFEKKIIRKVMSAPEGFSANGTLALNCDLVDDFYKITKRHIQTLIRKFKEHCFAHPWKRRNFILAGFDSESFETFFREKLSFVLIIQTNVHVL